MQDSRAAYFVFHLLEPGSRGKYMCLLRFSFVHAGIFCDRDFNCAVDWLIPDLLDLVMILSYCTCI